MPRSTRLAAIALSVITLTAMRPSHALTFNYTFLPGTSLEAQQGIRLAGAEWAAAITTNITVDLNFETGLRLDNGILGTTKSLNINMYYQDFRTHLAQTSSSAFDASAVAALPLGNTFGRLINRTSDDPAGSGSATPYVDPNGSIVHLSSANAHAIGLQFQSTGSLGCAANCDARIDVSTRYAYDYDPSDGIAAGSYDFVGIVRHEIGHALGFFSGVDILDGAASPHPANAYSYVSPLDLFRYSDLSAASHVIDFTADQRAKYLSLDGGVTMGPEFAEGEFYGDGDQASHWKTGSVLGAMLPTVVSGVSVPGISAADLMAMDAIGWSVAAVPEPAAPGLFVAGLVALGLYRSTRARGRSDRPAC